MANLLVLTSAASTALPALELLSHAVRTVPADPSALTVVQDTEILMVDATVDLLAAKGMCRLIRATDPDCLMFVIVTEGGLTALSAEWGVNDVLLATAGPAEVDARIRLAVSRTAAATPQSHVHTSGITIDESSYSAKIHGKPLDLTYKEFLLLHFLATHPSRVFTREQLLSEVWGYDYYGGTRTVDVHVRRLRAKLGDLEQVIGTVRNVGYRFNIAEDEAAPATAGM